MLISDERAVKALAYPSCNRASYLRVFRDLQAMGVERLIPAGNVDLEGVKVLGKGCVGVVVMGVLNGETVALKVLRSDANRSTLLDEGRLLSLANSCGVGPKLLAATDSALALEYIDGSYLTKWLEERRPIEVLRNILGELLRQARCLDEIGLDHGELTDARKHILISSREKPYILDFETASRSRRRRNLISIASYLFFKGSVSSLIGQYLHWDREVLVGLLRDYKGLPTDSNYERILEHVGLQR